MVALIINVQNMGLSDFGLMQEQLLPKGTQEQSKGQNMFRVYQLMKSDADVHLMSVIVSTIKERVHLVSNLVIILLRLLLVFQRYSDLFHEQIRGLFDYSTYFLSLTESSMLLRMGSSAKTWLTGHFIRTCLSF